MRDNFDQGDNLLKQPPSPPPSPQADRADRADLLPPLKNLSPRPELLRQRSGVRLRDRVVGRKKSASEDQGGVFAIKNQEFEAPMVYLAVFEP